MIPVNFFVKDPCPLRTVAQMLGRILIFACEGLLQRLVVVQGLAYGGLSIL